MRKTSLILITSALIWSSIVAQSPSTAGALIVKGKVNGISTGTVSVTTEVFNQKKTFTAPIAQGKFEVRITQPSPTLYSLVIKESPNERLLFFADNGILQIDAAKGNIGEAKVSGSISNKEYSQYNEMVEGYDQNLKKTEEVFNALEEAGNLLPKIDSLRAAYSTGLQKKDSAIQAWIKIRSKSFVSPFVMIINYADNGDTNMMRTLFDGFSPEVKKSFYGNFIENILVRKEGLGIGKKAPNFSQADALGKPISLESFKGKYVLVDFWASWCGPCRQENPNLVRTYQKFKTKNFEILGVSLDNNKEKWLQAIKDDQLNWQQVSDLKYWKNEVAVQYGVQSIPANFLLDKEGKIVAKGLRGQALDNALEQLLR